MIIVPKPDDGGKECVFRDGDLAIAVIGRDSLNPVYLQRTCMLQGRMGAFRHDDVIGKPWGCTVKNTTKDKTIKFLAPTPELWTKSLPHRTQILYNPDISMVLMLLNVSPGSRIVEAGTGSGSLTHSLARAIAPHGHVFTFDFHQSRVDTAKKEFVKHKISKIVTCQCGDVCESGFPLPASNSALVDGVFLDLPKPWLAIGHVCKVLRPGGGLVTFSPCIEQIQRTAEGLRDSGCFIDIRTLECLERSLDVVDGITESAMLDPPAQETTGTTEAKQHTSTAECNADSEMGQAAGAKRSRMSEESSSARLAGTIAMANSRDSLLRDPLSGSAVVSGQWTQEAGHTGFLLHAVFVPSSNPASSGGNVDVAAGQHLAEQ